MSEPLTTAEGALQRVASCWDGADRAWKPEEKRFYLDAAAMALDVARFYTEHPEMEVHE